MKTSTAAAAAAASASATTATKTATVATRGWRRYIAGDDCMKKCAHLDHTERLSRRFVCSCASVYKQLNQTAMLHRFAGGKAARLLHFLWKMRRTDQKLQWKFGGVYKKFEGGPIGSTAARARN